LLASAHVFDAMLGTSRLLLHMQLLVFASLFWAIGTVWIVKDGHHHEDAWFKKHFYE
jgi:hypothetical protein